MRRRLTYKQPAKVVHLPGDAYALAKEHCATKGYSMKEWVSQLIRDAVNSCTCVQLAVMPSCPVHSRAQKQTTQGDLS